MYKYKTNIRPYEPVDNYQVKVNIVESRDLKMAKTDVHFGYESDFTKTVNGPNSVSYVYEDVNNGSEIQERVQNIFHRNVEKSKHFWFKNQNFGQKFSAKDEIRHEMLFKMRNVDQMSKFSFRNWSFV